MVGIHLGKSQTAHDLLFCLAPIDQIASMRLSLIFPQIIRSAMSLRTPAFSVAATLLFISPLPPVLESFGALLFDASAFVKRSGIAP